MCVEVKSCGSRMGRLEECGVLGDGGVEGLNHGEGGQRRTDEVRWLGCVSLCYSVRYNRGM